MYTMSPGSGVGRSETLRYRLTSHLPLKYAAKCNDLQELDLAHLSMPNVVTPKTVLLGSGARVALFCVECGEEGVLDARGWSPSPICAGRRASDLHVQCMCISSVHQAALKFKTRRETRRVNGY